MTTQVTFFKRQEREVIVFGRTCSTERIVEVEYFEIPEIKIMMSVGEAIRFMFNERIGNWTKTRKMCKSAQKKEITTNYQLLVEKFLNA